MSTPFIAYQDGVFTVYIEEGDALIMFNDEYPVPMSSLVSLLSFLLTGVSEVPVRQPTLGLS